MISDYEHFELRRMRTISSTTLTANQCPTGKSATSAVMPIYGSFSDPTGAGWPTLKTSKAWREDPGMSYPKSKAITRLKENG